jgi:hypothetical protein
LEPSGSIQVRDCCTCTFLLYLGFVQFVTFGDSGLACDDTVFRTTGFQGLVHCPVFGMLGWILIVMFCSYDNWISRFFPLSDVQNVRQYS